MESRLIERRDFPRWKVFKKKRKERDSLPKRNIFIENSFRRNAEDVLSAGGFTWRK